MAHAASRQNAWSTFQGYVAACLEHELILLLPRRRLFVGEYACEGIVFEAFVGVGAVEEELWYRDDAKDERALVRLQGSAFLMDVGQDHFPPCSACAMNVSASVPEVT